MYKDVIVGNYYNLQVRDLSQDAGIHTAGDNFQPIYFGEDDGQRDDEQAYKRTNSRPQRKR